MINFLKKSRGGERLSSTQLFLLFAMEGALLQFSGSINGFGNNLFATNLGATDSQIGLIQTVPNLAAMLLMLPLGILSDRARSSRTVPLATLLVMTAGYAVMAFVPGMGSIRIAMFFGALILTVGGPAMYNAQWQSFFGDVIEPEARNNALTQRNRFMFIVGIAAPLLCGVMMGLSSDADGKLKVLQLFFILCALVTLAQAVVVSRIQPPIRTDSERRSFSMRDVGDTVVSLAKSRAFRRFFVPMILFYITWQIDWSMWYIGQTQYLHMTETDLSINNGVFNIGQLISIGLMSNLVRKRGNDDVLPFAALGLMFCPLSMIVCTLLPQFMRATTFTIMVTVLNATQCVVNLCVVQILLQLAPEKNRGLTVSLFTLTTTFTNSVMPYIGVQLYAALGSDYRAIVLFNLIVLASRTIVWLMLIHRSRVIRRENAASGSAE